jgi:hypothetical protein
MADYTKRLRLMARSSRCTRPASKSDGIRINALDAVVSSRQDADEGMSTFRKGIVVDAESLESCFRQL